MTESIETTDQYAAREATRYAVQQAQAVERVRTALVDAPTDDSLDGLIGRLEAELDVSADPSSLAIVVRDWGLEVLLRGK